MNNRQPIKLIIQIIPDNAHEDFNRVSMQMEAEHEVLYVTLINALVGIVDNLITEQKKHYDRINEQKEMVPLEQSETESTEANGVSIVHESGPTTYNPSDNGPVL